MIAHLTIHANGLAVAVAREDACLQAVRQCLVKHLTHKIIQPNRAKVEHGLADRDKRGQLQERGVDLLKPAGQLPHNLVAQLAPGGFLVSVGVHHHTDCARRVHELDVRQERVRGLELVKHRVYDRLRQDQVQVVQCLARVLLLHARDNLLVIFTFLAGELAHAAGRQHAGVDTLTHFVQALRRALLHVALDVIHHQVESLVKALAVIGLNGLLHLRANLVAREHVVMLHYCLPPNRV